MEVQKFLDGLMKNPYVMAVVKVSLILYASQLAPRLNDYSIFQNIFVKIIAIALLIYSAEKRDFQLAILIAVIYVLSINVMSGRKLLEGFSDFSEKHNSDFGGKLIEPQTHIYPGCQNITIQQLVDAFDGDRQKLTRTVISAYNELLAKLKDDDTKQKIIRMARAMGLSYKYELKDEHAPYIATLLVYFGFSVTDTCTPPNGETYLK